MSEPKPISKLFEYPAFLAENAEEHEQEARREHDSFEARQRLMHRERALSPVQTQLPPETFRAIVGGGKLRDTSALGSVKAWLEDNESPRVLVLSGPTGCGKTVAMAYALAETAGAWVTCTKLTRLSVANFGDEAEEYERLLRSRTLCLDDAGTERMQPDAVTSMLVELLEKRQAVRTLITTNLSAKDFVQRYRDDRLRSRLVRVRWVACSGEDLRRAK